MRKCKWDRTIKCADPTDCTECIYFKKTGQQTFGKPKPKPVKVTRHKGVKTTYYKVKK